MFVLQCSVEMQYRLISLETPQYKKEMLLHYFDLIQTLPFYNRGIMVASHVSIVLTSPQKNPPLWHL